jgi:hypothetical protein
MEVCGNHGNQFMIIQLKYASSVLEMNLRVVFALSSISVSNNICVILWYQCHVTLTNYNMPSVILYLKIIIKNKKFL